MKRLIFLVCLFYCFFRRPIYDSIAAIFWQSASYVLKFKDFELYWGAVFWQDMFRLFHDFWSQVGVVILDLRSNSLWECDPIGSPPNASIPKPHLIATQALRLTVVWEQFVRR